MKEKNLYITLHARNSRTNTKVKQKSNHKQYFEDVNFPPEKFWTGNKFIRAMQLHELSKNPKFIIDGTTYKDPKQG